MSDVFDFAPLTRSVKVRGRDYVVTAVTFSDLVFLVGKFPDIRAMMKPKTNQETGKPEIPSLNAASLISAVPDAIGTIIALCIGHKGDEKVEKWASSLGPTPQLRLLNAILEVTFEGEDEGIVPFVREFIRLSKLLQASTGDSDSNSVAPSGEQYITDFPLMQRGVPVRVNLARGTPSVN